MWTPAGAIQFLVQHNAVFQRIGPDGVKWWKAGSIWYGWQDTPDGKVVLRSATSCGC